LNIWLNATKKFANDLFGKGKLKKELIKSATVAVNFPHVPFSRASSRRAVCSRPVYSTKPQAVSQLSCFTVWSQDE